MAHKQDRQFPPADQLIEKFVASTGMNFALPHGFLNGKRNRHRPDIAEVQIRRETARSLHLRMVPRLLIPRQLRCDKLPQPFERGVRAPSETVYRLHGAVQLAESFRNVIRK